MFSPPNTPHGRRFRGALLALPLGAVACAGGIDAGSNTDGPSWEEFLASTYHEPFEHGVFIVNGDEPIENEKKLHEYWQLLYAPDSLIVHNVGGVDAKWSSSQKNALTYCVSDSFGARKAATVAAMNGAAAQWEAAADIDFIHDASQDGNCTATNGNVVFDVRPTSGAPYLARAFFPDQGRSTRNVIIDSSAHNTSWPLENILAHELGHALGFRHEHTRPEAGACFEDNNWRELTPYDSSSVMHYPQCNGSGSPLTMSQRDVDGAAALYGDPGGDGEPPPPPPGEDGTPRSGSDGPRSIARGQSVTYQPLSVLAGTVVDVSIAGSGDADLYVRFGAAPTRSQWDCRPYRWGSNESCSLDVPAGESQAYIMVYGYSSASFTVSAEWVEP